MSHLRPASVKRFFLRHPHAVLACLSVAFVLQAGLVPFDFQWSSIGSTTDPIAAPPSPLHDIVGNVFLFIPLGVFVQLALGGAFPGAFGVFLTLLSATLLSGGIEWIQMYSPSRVSSMIDVASNVGGAALGAMISALIRTVVPNLIGAALFEFRLRPATATLKAYALLLVILGAMPFTFAFDTPRFKQAVRQTVLIPFASSPADADRETPVDARDLDLVAWRASRQWLRWTAEAASFALLAWLLQIVLRGEYAFNDRSAAALTWWLMGVFAVGLSAGQFLVITRGLDVTDVLFRLLGVALGLLGWTQIRRTAMSASLAWIPCRAGAACVALWILLSGLSPFRFHSPEEGVLAPLSSTAFLPFMAYFETRIDLMLTDVLEKVISYGLLAALIAGGWPTLRRRPSGSRLVCTTAIGLTLATLIEAAQMFLPIRVVSLTDLVLAAVACLLGVMLEEHVTAFVGFVRTHRVLSPDRRPVAIPPLEAASPAETMMGSLIDAREDAPREPTPVSRDANA